MTNYMNPVPSPNRRSTTEETSTNENTRPTTPPPTDNRFQKLLKKELPHQPSKEEIEQMGAEELETDDNPPSLFDLSLKRKIETLS